MWQMVLSSIKREYDLTLGHSSKGRARRRKNKNEKIKDQTEN